MKKLSIDWYIPDFSFSDELHQHLLNAEYWNERDLEALCLGIPPKKYADTDCCGTVAERESVRARISAGIESGLGALYASRNPGAERIYGGVWHIEPAHAVDWVMSQIPQFSKFPKWLVSKLQNTYATQAAKRHASGRYTLDEASRLIAEQQKWGDAVRKKLLEQLMEAANAGRLRVCEPDTNMNAGPEPVRHFHEVVSHKDVNDWAALKREDWRWNVTPEPQAAPVVAVGAPGGVEPAKVGPVSEKPWLVIDPSDPKAVQSWYTPARYFARQLVMTDSTLLQKRSVLADKVSKSLANAGIKKRGGNLALNSATVLKAFSNVVLG